MPECRSGALTNSANPPEKAQVGFEPTVVFADGELQIALLRPLAYCAYGIGGGWPIKPVRRRCLSLTALIISESCKFRSPKISAGCKNGPRCGPQSFNVGFMLVLTTGPSDPRTGAFQNSPPRGVRATPIHKRLGQTQCSADLAGGLPFVRIHSNKKTRLRIGRRGKRIRSPTHTIRKRVRFLVLRGGNKLVGRETDGASLQGCAASPRPSRSDTLGFPILGCFPTASDSPTPMTVPTLKLYLLAPQWC